MKTLLTQAPARAGAGLIISARVGDGTIQKKAGKKAGKDPY